MSLVEFLILDFPKWLDYFDAHCPFTRFGQLESHRQTIARRREVGSAAAAVADDTFLRGLYRTLKAWGIGSRGSKLKLFSEFSSELRLKVSAFEELEGLAIDDPGLDSLYAEDALWDLINNLAIVENATKLVPTTKTLHHVFPDLVVPIDRAYTQIFFGWQNPKFQYGQEQCFRMAFETFVKVAKAVHPCQYVGSGWRTSRTKCIDNGVVGVVQAVKAALSRGPG